MTHPLAALIAGVPRYDASAVMWTLEDVEPKPTPKGAWVSYDEVLAALEAATPPDLVADDDDLLSELERAMVPYDPEVDAQEYWEVLCCRAKSRIEALIALAQSQAAQIAGLTKERDAWTLRGLEMVSAYENRLSASEAKVAELEAQIAGMIDADTVQKMLDIAQPIMAEACAAEEERANEAEAEAATLRDEVERLRGVGKDAADAWEECLGHVVSALGEKPDWYGHEAGSIADFRAALEGKA